jgi:hypothetical protein
MITLSLVIVVAAIADARAFSLYQNICNKKKKKKFIDQKTMET